MKVSSGIALVVIIGFLIIIFGSLIYYGILSLPSFEEESLKENPSLQPGLWLVIGMIISGILISIGLLIVRVFPTSIGRIKIGRGIAAIGTFILVLTIFISAGASTLFPLKIMGIENFAFEKCQNIPISFKDFSEFYDTFTCSFVGYKYSQEGETSKILGVITILVLWIFFYIVIKDLVSSVNIPSNEGLQSLLAFILGWIGLRASLESYLFNLLSFGVIGYASLFFTGLIGFGVWKIIEKFISPMLYEAEYLKLREVLWGPSTPFHQFLEILKDTISTSTLKNIDFVNQIISRLEFYSKMGLPQAHQLSQRIIEISQKGKKIKKDDISHLRKFIDGILKEMEKRKS